VEKPANQAHSEAEAALHALEAELGESVVYRATGRFLAAAGLGAVPLNSWGLIVLTATRVTFRHFSQAHPLFGGKDTEVRFEVLRGRFSECDSQIQSVWTKLFSGSSDDILLTGPGTSLTLELADDPRKFPAAWALQ